MKYNTRYTFRLDDIHPRMNWQKFTRVKDLFVKYSVRPVIAVIPDNKDSELNVDPANENFWNEIKGLKAIGWTAALHGLHHELHTKDPGLLGLHTQSEFAGLSYDVQLEKIQKGTAIMQSHDLATEVFIAPAHALDINTCKALVASGYTHISDGIAFYSFEKYGLRWIPQIAWQPRVSPFGDITICFHTDHFTEKDFERLEDFLKNNADAIVAYSSLLREPVRKGILMRIVNTILKVVVYARLRMRRILHQ